MSRILFNLGFNKSEVNISWNHSKLSCKFAPYKKHGEPSCTIVDTNSCGFQPFTPDVLINRTKKGGGGEWSITGFGGDALMQTKDLGWNVILQLITERIKPVEKAFLLTSKVIGCGQQPNTHDLETNWYMSWNWLDPNEKNHLLMMGGEKSWPHKVDRLDMDICPEKFHFWRPFPKCSKLRFQWGKYYIWL